MPRAGEYETCFMRGVPLSSRGAYRRLEAWMVAMDCVEHCYRATKHFPPHELYGLTSQMRRAAVSIPMNIAEGTAARQRRHTPITSVSRSGLMASSRRVSRSPAGSNIYPAPTQTPSINLPLRSDGFSTACAERSSQRSQPVNPNPSPQPPAPSPCPYRAKMFLRTKPTFAGRSARRRMYHGNQYSPYAISTRSGFPASTSRRWSGR
jgi:hypothetical protein